MLTLRTGSCCPFLEDIVLCLIMNCSLRRCRGVASHVLLSYMTMIPPAQAVMRFTRPRPLSALAVAHEEDHSDRIKHCRTCTCDDDRNNAQKDDPPVVFPCGNASEKEEELPPPLPSPKYSVYKRVLPQDLIALSSKEGRTMLLESLQAGTAESYWSLMEHFTNQSDPAYCGVTTLLIVLNSMSVDPNILWRGGWRYFGDEDVLLGRCCIPHERIRRAGINMSEFARLGKCQGLEVDMKQPTSASVNDFRKDVKEILSSENGIIVVSFSRSALGQTGEGHFSPIAAYHEETDQVLILDVARFKYAPYWTSISHLYDAMSPLDEATKQPRGWFVLHRPTARTSDTTEARRPAHLVPTVGQADVCPVGKVKVHYCEASRPRSDTKS